MPAVHKLRLATQAPTNAFATTNVSGLFNRSAAACTQMSENSLPFQTHNKSRLLLAIHTCMMYRIFFVVIREKQASCTITSRRKVALSWLIIYLALC
jgi:hypothetical protein